MPIQSALICRIRPGGALAPLLFDIAVPTGLYYGLTAVGFGSTTALVVGGVVPFARAVRSTIRVGKPDHLAALMTTLFVLALVLTAITGSPRDLLLRESFGTALVGIWFLASLLAIHPITHQTARPVLTQGRPEALAAWDRLTRDSSRFRSTQRRLTVLWGLGLLAEAGLRVSIVLHYPVHTAVGLVNVGALGVIGLLCMLSGPAGGLRLHRLLAKEINDSAAPCLVTEDHRRTTRQSAHSLHSAATTDRSISRAQTQPIRTQPRRQAAADEPSRDRGFPGRHTYRLPDPRPRPGSDPHRRRPPRRE